MSIINKNLLDRVQVSVKLKNPTQLKVRIIKPGADRNFVKAIIYGGLFFKYNGNFLPIFYLDSDVSVMIPTPNKDLIIPGGLDNVDNYPIQLIHLAMECLEDVTITVNDASYYELYKIKQFLDRIVPVNSTVRERFMVELYKHFKEVQGVMTYESVGDKIVFYLTDGSAVTQLGKKHVKMLENFVSMFKTFDSQEKEKFFKVLEVLLPYTSGDRIIVDERDGFPLVSVDTVSWVDLSENSDFIIAVYNNDNILANIEDTVILYSKRNADFEYIKSKAKYIYTIKLKNVKKAYKVDSLYLVEVKDKEMKYTTLKQVTAKIDEIDLIRTPIYSIQQKIQTATKTIAVKSLNLLSSLLDDEL